MRMKTMFALKVTMKLVLLICVEKTKVLRLTEMLILK